MEPAAVLGPVPPYKTSAECVLRASSTVERSTNAWVNRNRTTRPECRTPEYTRQGSRNRPDTALSHHLRTRHPRRRPRTRRRRAGSPSRELRKQEVHHSRPAARRFLVKQVSGQRPQCTLDAKQHPVRAGLHHRIPGRLRRLLATPVTYCRSRSGPRSRMVVPKGPCRRQRAGRSQQTTRRVAIDETGALGAPGMRNSRGLICTRKQPPTRPAC